MKRFGYEIVIPSDEGELYYGVYDRRRGIAANNHADLRSLAVCGDVADAELIVEALNNLIPETITKPSNHITIAPSDLSEQSEQELV